ncbi:hypothetical protein LCGC14_0374750 [marine sediment metagenome]|uniref:Uncharacterized protein n=1 Tax=marine sediment metagenome TaxID=412755 RepID=A0A0F9T497_9ZZZZ
MEKIKIPEDMIDEVEALIDIDKERIEQIESSVIFDGNQYTLKIPKKIADKISIDSKKDKFIFQIKTYPIEEEKKPDLTIKFKRK